MGISKEEKYANALNYMVKQWDGERWFCPCDDTPFSETEFKKLIKKLEIISLQTNENT